MQNNQQDQEFLSTIERLGIHGEGISYLDGYTVFIDGALPGEEVLSQWIEKKKSYGKAELKKIVKPSPARVSPPCPLFGRCGGCQLMHLESSSQLDVKRQRVIDALERIGKFKNVQVERCEASPSPLSYRNKIQVPIRKGADGIRIGFYARNSHNLIDVDSCHIHSKIGDVVYKKVKNILLNSGMTAYDWKTSKGTLRHLIIKTAVNTGQVLVILVTNGNDSKKLSVISREIMDKCPEVRGVVQNINTRPHNVVLGNRFEALAGNDYIEDKISQFTFKVSPASFFQVNPHQAEKLYQKAIDLAELTGEETVLDAYCGVGTMSVILSQRAKKVIGVECVPEAIADAKDNAKRNGLKNLEFICSDALEYIQKVDALDVIILNPPRKGCEPAFLQEVGRLQPKKIVYVSCDPATLARDLVQLKENGYEICSVHPFDMFPQTAHVETVVSLKPALSRQGVLGSNLAFFKTNL